MNIIIYILVLFFSGLLFIKAYRNIDNRRERKGERIILILLFIVHFLSFYIQYKFSLDVKKDSFHFYQRAVDAYSMLDYAYPGSRFMTFLVYPLTSLKLSYFSVSLFFSTIGLVGFVILIQIVLPLINKNNNYTFSIIFLFFLLMPSMHFWTAGITKEAVVVFLMAVVFRDIVKYDRLTLLIVISLFLILFIRPYLSLIFITVYLPYNLVASKKTLKQKLIIIGFVIAVFVLSLPMIKEFLNIDSLNYNSYVKVIGKIKQYSTISGNSSISLETTTYIERVFLALFRPLFYDAKNIFQLIISIENIVFATTLIIFSYCIITKKTRLNKLSIFLVTISILVILFLSIYMYNLGLASRMRVMFIPYLIISMILALKKKPLKG